MRWPCARLLDMASRIIFTASSASLATSCGKWAASLEINSDFVMISLVTGRMTQKLCRCSYRDRCHLSARSARVQPARLLNYQLVSSSFQPGPVHHNLWHTTRSAVLGPAVQRTRAHAEFLVSSLAFSSAPRL